MSERSSTIESETEVCYDSGSARSDSSQNVVCQLYSKHIHTQLSPLSAFTNAHSKRANAREFDQQKKKENRCVSDENRSQNARPVSRRIVNQQRADQTRQTHAKLVISDSRGTTFAHIHGHTNTWTPKLNQITFKKNLAITREENPSKPLASLNAKPKKPHAISHGQSIKICESVTLGNNNSKIYAKI